MFGRARNQTGILIELAEAAKEGYKDKEGRARLVDQIWFVSSYFLVPYLIYELTNVLIRRPYIEHANKISSTHSRLAKDAIILIDPARPLPRTPKGTISRSGSLAAYSKEINETYAVLEGSVTVSTEVGTPESWLQEEAVREWIQLCVDNILGKRIETSEDIFQQGMDR